MKLHKSPFLWLGIAFALFAVLFLVSLQRRMNEMRRLDRMVELLSKMDGVLTRQQEAARTLRNSNISRETATQRTLGNRDELNALLQNFYQTAQEDAPETQSFIQQLQQDAAQLESHLQDLRTGHEASLNKILERGDALQRNLQKQNTHYHEIIQQRTTGNLLFQSSALLLLAIILYAILFITWRQKESKGKRIADTFLALSRDPSKGFLPTPKDTGNSTDEESGTVDLEKAFRTCFDRFQKSMQVKDSFFASMSHEIRTPLNGLIGFLSNLAETPLNDQQKQYLRIIDSSARSLLHVMNQILDYSKIQAGSLALEEIPFALREFVEERVALARQSAKNKPVKVLLDFQGESPCIIRADAGRLRQVLDNLLNNGVKFTHRGEVVLEVATAPDAESPLFSKVDFTVRDSGIGIPHNVQQNLFKPFAQADNSIARKYGGTGLGLSISSALVNLMGGQMNLRSRPGEGSCFSFSIRVLNAKPEEQVRISELYRVNLPRTELKKYWTLLVDDTPTNLFLLETICQSIGLPYRTAENGREALELCRKQRFDLIFMDIQMPIMDGYTAIREIRKLDNSGRTHIIALTASAFQEDIDLAFGAGSTGFIPKPFERDQLLLCIADALGIAPEREFRDPQVPQETAEGTIVRRMHDFMREQYQISLGEIKMILAQTVIDWRPVLDNLATYAQQGNGEETIAILQRLKGQLVSIGLPDHSEQTVTIMDAFRKNDRNTGQILVTEFCQSLARIFKTLEREVTVLTPGGK